MVTVCGRANRLGMQTPRSTQPSIPPRSVNTDQFRLGRQKQVVHFIRVDMQVKKLRSWDWTTCAIHLSASEDNAISSVRNFTFTFIVDYSTLPLARRVVSVSGRAMVWWWTNDVENCLWGASRRRVHHRHRRSSPEPLYIYLLAIVDNDRDRDR